MTAKLQKPPAEAQEGLATAIAAMETVLGKIITDYVGLTQKVSSTLEATGQGALTALKKVAESNDELLRGVTDNFATLESQFSAMDNIIASFAGLDGLAGELLKLSDQLTAVEGIIKAKTSG